MSWRHELPLEEMLREVMAEETDISQTTTLDDAPREPGEASPRPNFATLFNAGSDHEASSMISMSQYEQPRAAVTGALESSNDRIEAARLLQDLFLPSSAERDDGAVFGSPNVVPQEPTPSTSPSKMQSGDRNTSLAGPNPRDDQEEIGNGLRSPLRRTRRQSRKRPSITNGQSTQAEHSALDPVHTSKVSKTRSNKRPGLRQRQKATESPVKVQLLSPGPDVPAASLIGFPAPARRSLRLQATYPNSITASDPSGGGSESRPRRSNTVRKSLESANPSGISKGRSRPTRRAARTN